MLSTELDSWEGVDHALMARGGAWEPLACLRFVAAQAPIYGDMDLNDSAASIHHHGSRNPFCAQAMDSWQRVVSIGAPLNQLPKLGNDISAAFIHLCYSALLKSGRQRLAHVPCYKSLQRPTSSNGMAMDFIERSFSFFVLSSPFTST